MWSDEYLIGNMLIDKQHRHLFAVASDLVMNYQNKKEVDKESFVSKLSFLKEYALNHFAEEEKIQKSIKYEGYAEHKKLHEDLLSQVRHHEKALVESDFSIKEVDSFISTLVAWLTHHVAVEDKKIPWK